MPAKIHDYGSGDWAFHCPGCGYDHSFRVTVDNTRPQWTWNGSTDKPTFKPSLLIKKDLRAQRCHSWVKDGKIQFLADSFHAMKGQTVELPDWDE
jgi:uncharacterized protein DUF6527